MSEQPEVQPTVPGGQPESDQAAQNEHMAGGTETLDVDRGETPVQQGPVAGVDPERQASPAEAQAGGQVVPSQRPVTSESTSEDRTVQAGEPVTIQPAATGDLPAPAETAVVNPPVQNQSAQLQPGAAAAAARAHAVLSHIQQLVQAYLPEVERFVPPEAVRLAQSEVKTFIQNIL